MGYPPKINERDNGDRHVLRMAFINTETESHTLL